MEAGIRFSNDWKKAGKKFQGLDTLTAYKQEKDTVMKKHTALFWIIPALCVLATGCATQRVGASIDKVIAQGPFKPEWESLETIGIPEWYKDVKLGIFIHWGVYSVPAFGNEWYPRNMYQDAKQGRRGNYFEHHVKTYGTQDTFGYKDFIPLFKAEKFDAGEWAKLFKESGAKYIVPVAEHHDGFPMYDCSFTRWNAAKMGPKRDIIGELEKAVRAEGLYFGVSSHRAFNWAYYAHKEGFDTANPEYFDLYGRPNEYNRSLPNKNREWPPQDKEFKDDWLGRTCELVEKYNPDLIWFDFGIGPKWVPSHTENAFAEHLKKFAAYYYNHAAANGQTGIINYKHHAFPEKAAVLDIERGKLDEIRDFFWQTDTSVSFNSWGYIHNQEYKTTDTLVDDLVDIVSKNGCLLLNIGPKADGTIPEPEADMLRGIGKWLGINGEAIYNTRHWKIFGEGPTGMPQAFKEKLQARYTSQDIRFTSNGDTLYAISLDWADGNWVIESLKQGTELLDRKIASVTLLGHTGALQWIQTPKGLVIRAPAQKPCENAYVFKITF